METSIKSKLKIGFTLARWGVDFCYGALFIASALAASAWNNQEAALVSLLMIPFVICIFGIAVFAIGRVMVGLQSRKLNFQSSRHLTEEERWFVSCMMEIEEKGSGVNFYQSAARNTAGNFDNVAAGAMASAVIGSFFKIGKKYMEHSFFFHRLPAIGSLAASVIIAIVMNI